MSDTGTVDSESMRTEVDSEGAGTQASNDRSRRRVSRAVLVGGVLVVTLVVIVLLRRRERTETGLEAPF